MKEKIEKRLEALQAEYQKGQSQLKALEQEVAEIKSTMLRISGAIQVLQELQSDTQASDKSISAKNIETINNHSEMMNSDISQ